MGLVANDTTCFLLDPVEIAQQVLKHRQWMATSRSFIAEAKFTLAEPRGRPALLMPSRHILFDRRNQFCTS